MGKQLDLSATNVELDATDGKAFIGQASPLTRLHYFDGQFLRAGAFALEQDYHRKRVQLSNIAGGWGAVNGLGIALNGNLLSVSAGLAITPAGNFVLAPADMQATLDELLQLAAPAAPGGSATFADCIAPMPSTATTAALTVYEITVGPIEGLCGNEPVYGKLCATACASDSDHPYWREGVVLRLRPVTLQLPTSTAVPPAVVHLRNRVASAYFRLEPGLSSSIVSGAGLAGDVWCQPATLYGRDEVVIGLLAIDGGVARVIDAWSGRRERMDSQPRGYWQGRMAMRPWNVYIAQILQFQCQLSGLFEPGKPVILPADDCDRLRTLLTKTRQELETLVKRYGDSTKKILLRTEARTTAKEMQSVVTNVTASFADLSGLSAQLADAEIGKGALPKQRMLLAGGFVELPPAGYLPVDPSASLPDQVQRMFGEGVRPQYHAVRHDEIAHLLEEAQHMERISLTRGLDDPNQLVDVEVFVPDGLATTAAASAPGIWWQAEFVIGAINFDLGLSADAKAAIEVIAARMKTAPAAASAVARAAAARRLSRASPAAPAPGTDDPTAELLTLLEQLAAALDTRALQGLMRSEARADGSFGLTLVATLDLGDVIAAIRDWIVQHPDYQVPAAVTSLVDNAVAFSVYIAADTDRDPLQLAIGDQANVRLEQRLFAGISTITGTLTAMLDRSAADGGSERVVQASLVAVAGDGKTSSTTGAIALERQSTPSGGRFVIDDAAHDPKTTQNFIEWENAPRRAAMYQQSAAGTAAVATRLLGALLSKTAAAQGTATQTGLSRFATGVLLLDAQGRERVATLTGLDGMPSLTSGIGAGAMNALVGIGAQTDDAAFVARARRRLFPTLDAPADSGVAAVLDWIMFRRARTQLCCANTPAPVVVAALEAIQAWHIEVENAELLKRLQAALDSKDPTRLAPFVFRLVGLLRYRDEQVLAEEPASQVLSMWAAAKPAGQVVLGRYWEQAPQTGQGWQNRFRLSAMLGQISALTKPPVAGNGSIAPLANLAAPLFNRAVDGGMLVVTMKTTQPPVVKRSALLIYGNADGPNHYPQQGTPQAPLEFDNDAPAGDALAAFIKALPAANGYFGFTLATCNADPDAGATARMAAVVAAWGASGRPVPPAGMRQTILRLNLHDHDWLASNVGVIAENYDEIIFFE